MPQKKTRNTVKKSSRTPRKTLSRTHTTAIPPQPPRIVSEPITSSHPGVILVHDQLNRLILVQAAWTLKHADQLMRHQISQARVVDDHMESWWKITHAPHHHYRNWTHWWPHTVTELTFTAIEMPRTPWYRVNTIQRELDQHSVSQQIFDRSAEWIEFTKSNRTWQASHDTWSDAYVAWLQRREDVSLVAKI